MDPASCGYCGGAIGPATGGAPAYLRCPWCGSLNLRPLPHAENNEYFDDPEAIERMDAADLRRRGFLAERLSRLEEAVAGKRGRLLDVGCATGRLMELATSRGWEVSGVELSPTLARKAAELLPDAQIVSAGIMEAQGLPPEGFQAIAALDVVEHVLDPLAFAQRLRELLAPGGAVLLHTPNTSGLRARLQGERWNMRISAYHYHLGTPEGFRALARRAGFASLGHRTTSGTGQEAGTARLAFRLKNSLLRGLGLGNGMELLWGRPGD